MELINELIEYVVTIIEIIGIIIIVGGLFYSFLRYILSLQDKNQKSYKILRHELGKVILLGLEILVAADIIETVLIEPTLDRVASLSLIVIIRTILSLSIEYELNGRVPWNKEFAKES